VSRLFVRRQINRRNEKLLLWALSLKPGDIINDCSAFNVCINKINPVILHTKHGWYIWDVEFEVGPFNGTCSLMHCGVELEVPREQVEKDWLDHTEKYINGGQMAHWYGNDKRAFNKQLKFLNKRIDALKSGGHITNERGMILKKYR
jgi:hypothetical protein